MLLDSIKRDTTKISTGFLTGHCLLGKLAKIIGITSSVECKYCQGLQCVKDISLIWCEFPSLVVKEIDNKKNRLGPQCLVKQIIIGFVQPCNLNKLTEL